MPKSFGDADDGKPSSRPEERSRGRNRLKLQQHENRHPQRQRWVEPFKRSLYVPCQLGMEIRMFLEKLDRQQWTLVETKEHIAKLIRAELEQQLEAPDPRPVWAREDPVQKSVETARSELMTALGDGDLHATGRLSLRRREGYAPGYSVWEFHSSYRVPISPEHWREGRLGRLGKNLEYSEGEFIDIRIPRFLALTIWPEPKPGTKPQASGSEAIYSTPYMDLMQAAIHQYGLSATHQDKKESLVAWFLEQEVDGEPVSRNLAEAMATLIRMPSAQRGGAKRMIGPDLRDFG